MRKTQILTVGILLLLHILLGYKSAYSQDDKLRIKGELSGAPDKTVLYLSNTSTQAIIDSSVLQNGQFEFQSQLESTPEILSLYGLIDGEKIYTWLLLGNEQVELKADIEDFPWRLNVIGSAVQDERELYLDYVNAQQKKVDFWVRKLRKEMKYRWAMKHQKAKDALFSQKWEYIQSHPNEENSLYVVNSMLSKLSREEVEGYYNSLNSQMKKSRFIVPIEVYLNEGFLEVGDPIHDFVAEDPQGKEYTFSEVEGNYILLSIMSSGCTASKASNEGLKKLMEVQDSIQVVSYYVDSNRERWVSAHTDGGGNWLSLWDGGGEYGKTYVRYGKTGFPGFILISPEKKIIAQWSGYSIKQDHQYIIKHIKKVLGKNQKDDK